jgi:hypothetical protein
MLDVRCIVDAIAETTDLLASIGRDRVVAKDAGDTIVECRCIGAEAQALSRWTALETALSTTEPCDLSEALVLLTVAVNRLHDLRSEQQRGEVVAMLANVCDFLTDMGAVAPAGLHRAYTEARGWRRHVDDGSPALERHSAGHGGAEAVA